MSERMASWWRRSRLGGVWRPVLPVAVLAGGEFALQRVGIDPARVLAGLALHHRGLAEALFVAAGAAMCFLGVPRQVVAYAGGEAFGVLAGTVLAVAATTLGCAASFGWARRVARGWVQQRLPGRVARVDHFLAANPFFSTLLLRLLPVGNNLMLNLVAGVSGVAARPFLLGSVAGYVPQALVFALIGAGTRVGEEVLLGIGGALFLGSAAIGAWLLRRVRNGYGADAAV